MGFCPGFCVSLIVPLVWLFWCFLSASGVVQVAVWAFHCCLFSLLTPSSKNTGFCECVFHSCILHLGAVILPCLNLGYRFVFTFCLMVPWLCLCLEMQSGDAPWEACVQGCQGRLLASDESDGFGWACSFPAANMFSWKEAERGAWALLAVGCPSAKCECALNVHSALHPTLLGGVRQTHWLMWKLAFHPAVLTSGLSLRLCH